MNRIQSIALIMLGLIWMLYSAILPMAAETAAVSDARQLESELKNWAEGKVRERKLKEEDVREIFPEGFSLKFGGENPNNNFREMVADIATRNRLPIWPGIIGIALGIIGLFTTRRNQKADPGGAGQCR